MEKKRILCLDLDGTVRRPKSGLAFLNGPDDVELIPGIKERIWKYDADDWLIIYVSNQGGVAYGFKTEEDVHAEIDATMELLKVEGKHYYPCFGWYLCFSAPGGKIEDLSWRSLSRKPGYGMLVNAQHDIIEAGFIPDWDNSLFIGDRPEDEQCALNAGIPFMYIDEFLKQQI